MQPYQHFTLEERESLRILLSEGKSQRSIAKTLGRSASSVSREIARNKNKNGSYHAWRATTLYIMRRDKCKKRLRLEADRELREWVIQCLGKYWSPEIITERWKMRGEGKLSHSTIYSGIRRGLFPNISPKTHLRRRGKRKGSPKARIQPERFIRDWPEPILKRERLGDWEGDTVYGAVGKGLLVTCVDRKSRFTTASLLKSRLSEETKQAILEALSGHKVSSLSLDNGTEFAGFKEIERGLNAPVYFADPHSPWQRASNENINGLIRFFFPRGTNFHEVSKQALDEVLTLINDRPRKCLGWLSPNEFLTKCCT